MKKNNQSRPMYPGARRQNQEGFLQKYFPVIMLVLTALAFWFRLELAVRVGNLMSWVILVAAVVVTIIAFVAKHNGTTIAGLWTSWRARRESYEDEDEDEGYNPQFGMPYMTMTEDEFHGYRPSVPVAPSAVTPKPEIRFDSEVPVAPASASAPAVALPDGFVMLDELKLAAGLVKVHRDGKWVIEPSKEKEEGHNPDSELYDPESNSWLTAKEVLKAFQAARKV